MNLQFLSNFLTAQPWLYPEFQHGAHASWRPLLTKDLFVCLGQADMRTYQGNDSTILIVGSIV